MDIDSFIYLFVFTICLMILYKYNENNTYEVLFVKAQNGNSYLVRNLSDKQEAANTLGDMADRFSKLVDYVNTHDKLKMWSVYVDKNPGMYKQESDIKSKSKLAHYNKFVDDINRLVKNYNPNVLSENTPDSKFTSYSENKGQKIVFCMRDKSNNKLVDLNTMMFVGLHELSHLMTRTVGHDEEFWSNFKIILRIAIRLGIYKCQDFEKESKAYCGTRITDSPLRCGDV
jgi:hypothetical protein